MLPAKEATLRSVSKSAMCVKILCHGYAQASLFNDHAVSVTQRHGFFLHNERGPFIRDAHDSLMMTTAR